ncbi:MAG: L-lactate dehydrogenase [Chloroflexota bacterium]|nr:MAG: L-lactate dehydrogenase [Chloroflexota bacterium]
MKVGIIGSGMVGATAAYAMVMRGVGREIVLVDVNKERAQAEADDILHAAPFAHAINVHAGDYNELADSKVIVVTAGANQRTGETRLQLLGRNASVFKQIIPSILEYAPNAILLITTNPVDIMTHLAARMVGEHKLPPRNVIGSGTTLDTARFRALLGRKVGVDPYHIHGYVIGEHGDSEVFAWSLAAVGGIPMEEFCKHQNVDLCGPAREEIEQKVRRAAYAIIEGKGATYYGIGSALSRIVEAILKDQRTILTICKPESEVAGVKDVTVALPHLVGGQGVISSFPLPLNDREQSLLHASAAVVRKAIEQLDAEVS